MSQANSKRQKRKLLLQEARDMIEAVADDKSVSTGEALKDLEALEVDLHACMDGLRDDIKAGRLCRWGLWGG